MLTRTGAKQSFMQAPHHLTTPIMSNILYYQPVQEAETYYFPQFQTLDHQLCYSRSISHGKTSPTLSFSPNGSPTSQQESQSCVTDDIHDFRHKLRELETVMLGPDSDILDGYEGALQGDLASPEIHSWRKMIESIPRRDLKQVLISCAKAVSENDVLSAQCLLAELQEMVSVSGEPIERLGAYMLEALVARLAAFSGVSIYQTLRCKEPASADLLSYVHVLYEVCPYFKFGYMSANGAIAEAMKDENRVHIIDFQIGLGSQWVTLIQAFAGRPGGPPHICITGIDDPMSAYARGGGLNIVGQMLSRLAKSCKVPFEFHEAAMSDCEIQIENLRIRPGEAIAVNFAFVLHRMPDESVSTQNHRDRLLRHVKSLSPKVVTLVEQESNTNTAAFFPRFLEAFDYYSAMFESIDATLPRAYKERINVEQHCLARDIMNMIACEGAERVERHELLGKWKSRFRMAGFAPYPLSSLVNATIKTLLDSYSDKYRLEERDGALYLGWMSRDLVASCAWK
ncbi:DNA topoisomerase 2-associated protein pat1 [Sarracenia purpurea var. burkii]